MNLRTALSLVPGMAWMAPRQRAATRPMQFTPPGSQNFGPGIGNQPSVATLLRESTGPFDSASRAIANRLSELALVVKVRRRTRAGTVEDEELDDHPLRLLLDRPHPNLSRAQILFLAARHILAAGAGATGSRSGMASVSSSCTRFHRHRSSLWYGTASSSATRHTDGRGRRDEPANVVVRCFFPDPENPWGAEGYLSPSGSRPTRIASRSSTCGITTRTMRRRRACSSSRQKR